MTKKTEIPYDFVHVTFVPKAVDNDPHLFADDKKYWGYAVEQVHGFLSKLPDVYKGKVAEERFEEEKAAMFKCEGSPYELIMGFKPSYHLLVLPPKDTRQVHTLDDCIACPTIDVGFKPVDEEGARTILSTGLNQFYLEQGDLDDGTLIAVGAKNGEIVHRDLEMLRTFLPQGTVIEARCNYGMGNGQATYRL